MFKSEKEKYFAYSFHTACDRNGIIFGIEVTAANVYDSSMFESVLEQVKSFGTGDACCCMYEPEKISKLGLVVSTPWV